MSNPPHDLRLRVGAITRVAKDVHLYELRDGGGAQLPPFTAGAHIALRLAGGLSRRYSLCNDPAERDRYEIAVKRERNAPRLIESTSVGGELQAMPPHNSFELVRAGDYVFIAGGIGITALLSMVRHLQSQAHPRYHLYYLTPSPEATAFREELTSAPYAERVTLHHDNGEPDRGFDLWPVLEHVTQAHVYCCGPRSLLESVRDMTGHWPPSQVHFESYVDAAAARRPGDRPFTVRFAQSGDTFEVPPGVSILDAARSHGHDVPISCESGTCGTCKTRYIAGNPDHRDLVLADEEKREFVMPCVSRSKSDELVLDR